MYVHACSILLQYVCTCMVNTATICMYRHGQYCYNMYVRHGTYPGLPGSIPQIPYSLYMLTTLGRGLLGEGKERDSRTTWDTVILYDFV